MKMTVYTTESMLDRGCIWILMHSGRWWRLRRNGMTKRWKREPQRFRIPVKAGLRVYSYLEDTTSFRSILAPDAGYMLCNCDPNTVSLRTIQQQQQFQGR